MLLPSKITCLLTGNDISMQLYTLNLVSAITLTIILKKRINTNQHNFFDSAKLKVVLKKMTTFPKRRVSIIR